MTHTWQPRNQSQLCIVFRRSVVRYSTRVPRNQVSFALFSEDDATGLPKEALFQPTLMTPSPELVANVTAALAEARSRLIVSAGDKSRFGFLGSLPARLHAEWTQVDLIHDLTSDTMEKLYWRSPPRHTQT